MSGFMRRFVAFLLGVAVGAVALFGGVTSGALWAFRNASPLELVGGSSETEEGGLGDLSTEDLLKILNAANDSSGYSLKRLSKQFGLDLRSMLTDMGIDVTGVDDEDLEAISELNVFALLSSDGEGLDRLLSSIRFRSLYVLMPALTGKNVGEILSVEAQEKLGDYYLSDLFEVGDDGHTRFLSLVKDLPVGSVFPSVFEAVYDEARHSYSYVNRNPRADGKPSLADIMGDVPIGALFNVVEGNSIAKELIEGKLKVVSKLPIQKILSSLASNVGIEEVSVFLENLAATVGSDVTLLDVFVENEDGGYSLSYDEILRNLNLGYMFGYYTDGEGNWYKDEAMTEPVDGLLGVIAKIDVGELYSGGESIKMVEAVFGNVTLYNLFKTFAGEEDTVPFIVNALGDMTLSDIIAEGQENIVGRLVENLDLYIGDIAIADLIDDLLSDEAKATIEDSALLSALVNVDVGALLKKEYTEEVIVQIIKNIFGDLSIADIVGDLNPDFETGALLGKLFEITVSDIIDQFNGGTALQDRLSDVTLEDVFKEFDPEWEAGPITEKIADITLSEIIYALQGDSADLEDRIYDITIGDLVNEINPDFESTDLLDKVFEISFEDIVDAIYGDGDAIEQKFGDITLAEIAKEFNPDWEANDLITDIFESVTVSDVLAVLRGEEDAVILLGDLTLGDIFGMVFDYELNDDGVWSKGDQVVTYGFNDFLAARVADVIDGIFGDGDYSIKQEIKNLTVGDVVYNLLEAADMNDELVYEDGVVSTEGNLKNLSSVIFQLGIGDVLENATDVDWWLDVEGDLLVGDFAAFFFNGMTSGSATYDDGWVVSYNKLEELLNNAFNARVGDVISAVKDRDKLFFEGILGETTLGELADVIYTDWRQYSSLETLLDVPAVDVIE
ncbi:MAG: hypothetical protein J6Y44_02530, partial [Clostridia bacterium]|nr:hypothetical protein [Clostridia bacterium]